MDKNTVIGLSLIGLLLVTFTYMNQPSQEELAKKAKTEKAAKDGVVISNPSKNDPIVILKHFGPENPDLIL